jgi:hypothetical protein
MQFPYLRFDRNLSNWDTRAVTDMSQVFSGVEIFDQDLSHRDTRRVADMPVVRNTPYAPNRHCKAITRFCESTRNELVGADVPADVVNRDDA